jgi:hypothetical protein
VLCIKFDHRSKCYERSGEVIQSPIPIPSSGKVEPELNFNRIVSVFGTMTLLIGVFGLLGWIPWFRVLTGIHLDYISIAPVSSAGFLVFGLILLLLVRKQYHDRSKVIVSTIIAFISIYGLLEFVGYFADVNLTFDSVLFSAAEKLGPFDVKRMSPLAGILFFFSGVSLQLKVFSEDRLKILNLVGGYGLITLLAGFIAAIG